MTHPAGPETGRTTLRYRAMGRCDNYTAIRTAVGEARGIATMWQFGADDHRVANGYGPRDQMDGIGFAGLGCWVSLGAP